MSLRGNHYEVLGISSHATPDQVERAFAFAEQMYGEHALATYSLLDPQEREGARARVREAYEVLRDPLRRREYDIAQGLGTGTVPLLPFPRPAAAPPPPVRAAATPEPSPPAVPRAPQVLAGAVTGEALRRFREASGVTLHDIASASKVGVRTLEYIEGDRFEMLPAPVYLRGFLQEYARIVGLEPRRTAEAYLQRLPR